MPAPHPPIDDLAQRKKPVSLIQLADWMGTTRRTLYSHVEKGALKTVKRGGFIRVTAKEARRYAGVSEKKS